MKSNLWKAATFSLAVHAGLLVPRGLSQAAVVDVERDLVNLEVELFSAVQLPTPEALEQIVVPLPSDEAWQREPTTSPPRPQPSPELVEGHGAATEAKPQTVRNRPPAYPWLARMQGWEGTVMLRVLVNPDGAVGQSVIQQSSGHAVLDEAARRAVHGWRFLPARIGSIHLASWVIVPVRFQLIDGQDMARSADTKHAGGS